MEQLKLNLKKWVVSHDDSRLFVVFYLFLAVFLSVFLSLFWLVFVVFVHFIFEFIKQNQIHSWKTGVVLRSLWEVKLDIALILFSLALVVYLDFIFGVAGINAAARVGGNVASRSGQVAARSGQIARVGRLSRILTKIAGWQRVIRAVMMTVDDVFIVLKAVFMKVGAVKKNRKNKKEEVHKKTEEKNKELTVYGMWVEKWDFGDKFSIFFTVFCFLLFIMAPFLTSNSLQEVYEIIIKELKPFP